MKLDILHLTTICQPSLWNQTRTMNFKNNFTVIHTFVSPCSLAFSKLITQYLNPTKEAERKKTLLWIQIVLKHIPECPYTRVHSILTVNILTRVYSEFVISGKLLYHSLTFKVSYFLTTAINGTVFLCFLINWWYILVNQHEKQASYWSNLIKGKFTKSLNSDV